VYVVTKPTRPQLQRDHPLARNLISAWLFSEGGGSIARDHVMGLNGALSNVAWSIGGGGRQITSNGTTSLIQCDSGPAALHATEKLSVVYASTPGAHENSIGYVYLFGPGADTETLVYEVVTDKYVKLAHLTHTARSNVKWVTGVRHMIAITHDSVGLPTFYINGLDVGVTNENNAPGPTATPQVDLLNRRSDTARTYAGPVEFLYVYNRVITQNEVRALYLDPYAMFRGPRPINLAIAAGLTTVRLTWTDNAEHETRFSIERDDDGGGFVEIDTVAADVETYDDTVDEGHTYTYRVRALSAALGNSEYSNEDEVTV